MKLRSTDTSKPTFFFIYWQVDIFGQLSFISKYAICGESLVSVQSLLVSNTGKGAPRVHIVAQGEAGNTRRQRVTVSVAAFRDWLKSDALAILLRLDTGWIGVSRPLSSFLARISSTTQQIVSCPTIDKSGHVRLNK